MHTFPRHALVLALSALIVTALPACEKARDAAVNAAIERATGAKVERNGDEITVRTEQGDLRMATAGDSGNLALPTGFPKEIQLPANYKVASVMEMGSAHIVSLNTPESMGNLFNALSSGMDSKGWKRELSAQTEDGGTLGFSKGHLHVVYYIAKGESGGSDVNINVSSDENPS